VSEIMTAQELKSLKSLQPLLLLSTGVADILPFVYLLIASRWKSVPAIITIICSLAPPIIGVSTLLVLTYLSWKRVALKSDGVRIAVVLAIVGILEPIFYWI
jgi:hypothetical protein